MTRFRAAALAAALTFAVSSFASLSPKYREWGEGPAKWIMTADEHRDWAHITSDDAAESFIELFWARRDPTPGTPVNEFNPQRRRRTHRRRVRAMIPLGAFTMLAPGTFTFIVQVDDGAGRYNLSQDFKIE